MMRVLVLALMFACGAPRSKVHVESALVADAAHAGVVRGTVTSESGQPARGASVVLQTAGFEIVAITDENGAFVVSEALPEGKYRMVVYWGARKSDKKVDQSVVVKAGFATVVRVSGISEPQGELL